MREMTNEYTEATLQRGVPAFPEGELREGKRNVCNVSPWLGTFLKNIDMHEGCVK